MQKVAIILLNWNQSEYTINCITSLERCSYKHFTIFLIDNGSCRDELEKLETFLSTKTIPITYMKSKRNLGFTGGNNLLLEKVLQCDDFTYSLLLNNDTVVEQDFLSKLVLKLEEKPEYGSVGPLVLNAKDRTVVDSAGTHTVVTLAQGTLLGHGKKLQDINPVETEVGYVTGCAVLIKNEVLKKVGLLDNNFFAYFEDIDLGVRINKAGYENIFYPDSVIYHYGSISTGERSEFYYMLSCRNRLLFAQKHNSAVLFYLLFIPYFLLWKIAVKFLTSKSKGNFLRGHYKGLLKFITKKGV